MSEIEKSRKTREERGEKKKDRKTYPRNELEAVVSELVVVAVEEGPGNAPKRRILLNLLLVALQVHDETQEGWARDHNVHDKAPSRVPALVGEENAILRMRRNIARGLGHLEHVDRHELEERGRGQNLLLVLVVRLAAKAKRLQVGLGPHFCGQSWRRDAPQHRRPVLHKLIECLARLAGGSGRVQLPLVRGVEVHANETVNVQ
jgi:hypothetical protein